jgi:hypothetical protein
MIPLVLGLLAVLAASALLDRLIRPTCPWSERVPASWLIQSGLIALLYGIMLLLTQRPGFAAALTLALQLLLVLVNNAKFKALREPFVFTDFGLFSQAVKHPRLYLPFLGVLPAGAALLGLGLALYLGIALETSLLKQLGSPGFATVVAALLALAMATITVGTRLAPAPALLAEQDLRHLGLLASLWLYLLAERRHDPAAGDHPARQQRRYAIASEATTPPPHLLVVQSESFFDARRLYPRLRPGLLGHFDRLCREASAHGALQVPAWGANTMRTEFAFLSGLNDSLLGVHRFNPFRRFAHHPWHTLPIALRSAGYRTICVHPHPAGFFGRDRIYPKLGFDEFIDIRAFRDAERFGPYVSDAAVTAKLRELLAGAAQPTFMFAITMENHGPLHMERVMPGDIEHLYDVAPPPGFDDLTIYLRHLANADRMLGELAQTCRDDDCVLCFYGDHVPSMPQVYAKLDFHDGRSDYLIWRPGDTAGESQQLAADQLGERLLQVAGLAAATR